MSYQTRAELKRVIAHQGAELLRQGEKLNAHEKARGKHEADVLELQMEIAGQKGTIDASSRGLRAAADREEAMQEHIRSLDRALDDKAATLRLSTLQTIGGYSQDEELVRRATWVLTGQMPERNVSEMPVEEKAVPDAPNEGMPTVAGPASIDYDIVRSAYESLLPIASQLESLRTDSNVRAGRVRIQRLAVKLDYVMESLRHAVGAPEVL